MSNLNFVISLKFKGQNEVEKLFNEVGKKHNVNVDVDTSKIEAGITNLRNPIIEFKNNVIHSFSQVGFVINGVKESLAVLKGSFDYFVKPADSFEQLRVRLVNLYQDQEKANEVFEKFKDIASTTPYELENVVNAGSQLKAFGLDAEGTLKSVTDLAAYMGVDVVESANAVGRAFAGGAGAADILRERGVLNLIKSFKGIDDLTKLSLPEFRKAMMETFVDPTAGIAGSTSRLSKTYTGAISNMKDAITNFRAEIGSHLLPILTKAARGATDFFRGLTETSLEKTIRELKDLGASSKEIIKLEKYANTMQLAEVNAELKKRRAYYNDIKDVVKELEDISKKSLEIGRGKARILQKEKMGYDDFLKILTNSGVKLEKAKELAKGFADEINAGMSGKATMGLANALDQQQKTLNNENKILLKNKDLIIEREELEKKINEANKIRQKDNGDSTIPGVPTKDEIAAAQAKINVFWSSLKTKRDQLESDYNNKKSLIETAYIGDPEMMKAKLIELATWYKGEQEKINSEEEKAKKQEAEKEIAGEKQKYQAALQLMMAKKRLGMNVNDELQRTQAAYIEWVKEKFGEESFAYKNAMKQMRDANLHFTDNAITNFRKQHFIFREMTDSFVAGFRTAWDSILDNSMTGKERLNAIWISMRSSFLNAVGSMAAAWLKKHLVMRAISLATGKIERIESVKTAATEKASILGTIALKIKSALASIGGAIAGGFKWLVSTLGPFGLAAGIALGAGIIAAFNGIRKKLGFADGGLFRGVGGPRDDKNIIAVSDNEYIVNAEATKRYLPLLDAINFGGETRRAFSLPTAKVAYASGGQVMGGFDFVEELRGIKKEIGLLREDVYKASPNEIELKDSRSGFEKYKAHLKDKAAYERQNG